MGTRYYSIVLVAALAAPAASVGRGDTAREAARLAAARAEVNPEPALRIRVRAHNHAHVPKATLKRAQQETTWILRRAGVETTWHTCGLSPVELGTDPECEKPRTPTGLDLRILPRKMARRLTKDRNVYGWAVLGRDGASGYLADIFYHRVEELALRQGAPCSLFLGLFMAHEIGHLLLGANSHSPSGIMHVPYEEIQLERTTKGPLLFTPSQARRIRSEVVRRMTAGVSHHPSALCATDCNQRLAPLTH